MDGAQIVYRNISEEPKLITWAAKKAIARRRVRPHDVEDFRSQLIIRLLEKANEYDPERGSFSTWAYWQARHVYYMSFHSKNARGRLATASLDVAGNMVPHQIDQFEEYDRVELQSLALSAAKTAIERLPEMLRNAISETILSGKTINQVSRDGSVKRSTLQERVRDGIRLLRMDLAKNKFYLACKE